MLDAAQVIDRYYLDTRCMLLEIAATLDRLDLAAERDPAADPRSDARVQQIYRCLAMLADPAAAPGRAERLLQSFSD